MKHTIFLFLFLIAIKGYAQQSPDRLPLLTRDSLERYHFFEKILWKYHPGDDTAWAAVTLNDSGWVSTQSYFGLEADKGRKIIDFKGRGWFRLHFISDSTLIDVPVALTMEQDGATEIYLDGKLIKRYGQFRNDKGERYLDPKDELAIVILKPGEHLLAIRYENYNAHRRFEKYGETYAGFTMTFTTPENGMDSYQNLLLASSIVTLISGSIFLALFIVHFILFLFYRAAKSNLIFSLFNLSFALVFFTAFAGTNAKNIVISDATTIMVNLSLSLSCFSISALVNNLFGRSRIRFLMVTLACITVLVLSFLNYEWSTYVLAGLGAFCALEAAIMVCVAMYRKVKGARILGAGILFFVIFFVIIIVVSISHGGIELHNDLMAFAIITLAVMAIFSIPFSMSAYLAWSFAAVSRDLKNQLRQVEVLSQKTLQQEQEKQLLLENKKEELEQEVAARTAEVLQQKEKIEQQHEALKTEKKKSDDLLLNILPAEVAEELKETGTTKAQHFDHVSVLFTDFVNFTQISEVLSPDELVQELHECFRAFDDIMERNGLEKIKTIGDAYLAVSGMPVANERHAYCAVKAGLEIIDFVGNRTFKKHAFKVRVGVNSGPLVAGIVGVKKFAYDIWGDTVNMASRMESNSESGKVNISENTHALVLHDFTFTYRGKINAKNKGEVDMYFVDTEKMKS